MADIVNPTYDDNGRPEWDVAGYTDFAGNYHEADDGYTDAFPEFWHSDTDLVTIVWTDAMDGSEQYARIEGPFEDQADLEDRVDTYFEEGSP